MKKLFAKTRHKLTSDETQEVITPFAFKLDDSLFGTAIASPYKRGIAILIDLLLIAILSSAGGEFLAMAIAYSVFRMGSKARAEQQGKVKGRKRRAILRFIGAIFILVVLLDVLSPMVNKLFDDDSAQSVELDENIVVGKEIGFADALKVTGFIINTISDAKDKNCQNAACWQNVLQDVPEQAIDLELYNKGMYTDDFKDMYGLSGSSDDGGTTILPTVTGTGGDPSNPQNQTTTTDDVDDSAEPGTVNSHHDDLFHSIRDRARPVAAGAGNTTIASQSGHHFALLVYDAARDGTSLA